MFDEHDTFVLCQQLSDATIPVGTHGVVLMVYGEKPCSYDVEFPDGKGGNLGKAMTYTITGDFMGVK